MRLIWDHLRSIASGTVYTRYAYSSAEFERRLNELMTRGAFDIVHMDSLDLSAYIPQLGSFPVVCTHHNVESKLLRRRALAEESAGRRAYLKHQAGLAEKEEKTWCPRVRLNVVVSENDLDDLKQIAPNARYEIIPSGVDTQVFKPGNGDGKGVVFVGGYGWFPNRDGMSFFAMPFFRICATAVSMMTFGGLVRLEDAIQFFNDKYSVHLTGYVRDIQPFVQEAACYIVPLRVGGGTRLKILNAWAMGKAIVSTSVGCEGLQAKDGENILIRDDPQDFANAVQAVVNDLALRRRLQEGARATAVNVYDWDKIAENMSVVYKTLIHNV